LRLQESEPRTVQLVAQSNIKLHLLSTSALLALGGQLYVPADLPADTHRKEGWAGHGAVLTFWEGKFVLLLPGVGPRWRWWWWWWRQPL